jgi:predicted metalloprotease with PDZ domain
MPAIKIYGIPTPPSVWDVIDLPSSSADGDGTVGFGFLKNFNITIDYERRRVWFENFTGKIANEVEGEVGISAFYNPPRKRTLIVAVAPASPADKAGLKAGDELLSVAGTELIEADFRRVSRMLAGPVGSKVAVVASRRGTLVRAELERKALVNSLD